MSSTAQHSSLVLLSLHVLPRPQLTLAFYCGLAVPVPSGGDSNHVIAYSSFEEPDILQPADAPTAVTPETFEDASWPASTIARPDAAASGSWARTAATSTTGSESAHDGTHYVTLDLSSSTTSSSVNEDQYINLVQQMHPGTTYTIEFWHRFGTPALRLEIGTADFSTFDECHQLRCGTDSCPSSVEGCAHDWDEAQVACCSDVDLGGWQAPASSCSVYGQPSTGACRERMIFASAEAYCAGLGARLCTAEELESSCVDNSAHTGCGDEDEPLWSSTGGTYSGCWEGIPASAEHRPPIGQLYRYTSFEEPTSLDCSIDGQCEQAFDGTPAECAIHPGCAIPSTNNSRTSTYVVDSGGTRELGFTTSYLRCGSAQLELTAVGCTALPSSAASRTGVIAESSGLVGGPMPDGHQAYLIHDTAGFVWTTLDGVDTSAMISPVVSIWVRLETSTEIDAADAFRVWIECSDGTTEEMVSGGPNLDTTAVEGRWIKHEMAITSTCDAVVLSFGAQTGSSDTMLYFDMVEFVDTAWTEPSQPQWLFGAWLFGATESFESAAWTVMGNSFVHLDPGSPNAWSIGGCRWQPADPLHPGRTESALTGPDGAHDGNCYLYVLRKQMCLRFSLFCPKESSLWSSTLALWLLYVVDSNFTWKSPVPP